MPTQSRSHRRASLRKGDEAKIPMPPDAEVCGGNTVKADGDMSDDGKKPWETDDAKKGDWDDDDDAKKSDDEDEDEDEDDETSKGDGDDDKDGDDSTSKSRRSFRADLQKAVALLTRHGELHDPALRKEALMAKELKGGGLSKSERSELVGILSGRSPGLASSADAVARHQAPGPALRKSMVDNSAMAEAYDNVTKSIHAQARFLDHTAKSLEATNYAMARALVKASETIGEVHQRQEQLAEAVEQLASQPAHAPRSIGLGWSEKSFAGEATATRSTGSKGGRLAKSSPQKIQRALSEMAKSVSPSSPSAQAYKNAAHGLMMNRPLLPSVAAQVEQYLSEQAS